MSIMTALTKRGRMLGELAEVWHDLTITQQLVIVSCAVWGTIEQMDKHRRNFYRLVVFVAATVITGALVFAASESWLAALAIGVIIGYVASEVIRSLK